MDNPTEAEIQEALKIGRRDCRDIVDIEDVWESWDTIAKAYESLKAEYAKSECGHFRYQKNGNVCLECRAGSAEQRIKELEDKLRIAVDIFKQIIEPQETDGYGLKCNLLAHKALTKIKEIDDKIKDYGGEFGQYD